MIDRLVVLGGTVTGLAVVRDAHRLGIETILICGSHQPAFESCLATASPVDETDDVSILAALEAVGRPHKGALICDSDRMLRFLRRHLAWIGERFGRVLHPGEDALAVCLDKAACGVWCRAQGLPTPATYALDPGVVDVSTGVQFPVLVRPEETQHGMGRDLPKAVEIHDAESLRKLLVRFRDANVRPVINASVLRDGLRQYSIGAARRADGESRAVVAEKRRPTPRRCAAGSYVEVVDAPQMRAIAVRALDALDYIGIAEVEILHDPSTDEAFLIEINARPWAQYPLAARAGVDLLAFVLGREETARPVQRPVWIDFSSDLYHALASDGMVRGGEMTLWAWLGSLMRANCFAYWHPRDRRPFSRQARLLLEQLMPARRAAKG